MFKTVSWTDLITCTHKRWSPVIGDPTVAGWVTVAVYAACALLAAFVVIWARAGRERKFWVMTALLMTFLAINKELDLQSALTAMGRCLAQLQGWYDDRRVVQREFIMALLAATLAGFAIGLFVMRHDLARNGLAILGLTVVAGFVAVRAVGFHHFDNLINARFMDVRFNFVFEVSGLILIALNAVFVLLRPQR